MATLSFLEWTNLLVQAGTRVPQATPLLLEGVNDFSKGVDQFEQAAMILAGGQAPPAGLTFKAVKHQPMKLTAEEEGAQARVVKLVKACEHESAGRLKAIGDGSLIQLIQLAFQFLNANPQFGQLIMNWLTSILQKKNPSPAPQV